MLPDGIDAEATVRVGRPVSTDTYVHRILGVDPGGTTGWAVVLVDKANELHLRTGTCTVSKIQDTAHMLRARYVPQRTIVERLPMFSTNPLTRHLMALVEAAFPTRYEYGPGEWKPVTGLLPIPKRDEAYTQHEKDAYRLALYALRQIDVRPIIPARTPTKLRPRTAPRTQNPHKPILHNGDEGHDNDKLDRT